jgi:uncharacterized membrane protein
MGGSRRPWPSLKRPVLVWGILAALSLTIAGLIVAAPLATAYGHDSFAFSIYRTFGHLCHQIPERSFHVAGHPFAVCARCTGLYFGFAAGVVLYPIVRSLKESDGPSLRWLFIAALPLVVDWGLGMLGIWENTHLSRVASGALLGGMAAVYVVPGVIDLSLYKRRTLVPAMPGRATINPSHPSTPLSDYSAPSRRI